MVAMTVEQARSSSQSRHHAEPRWATPRSPERPTFGDGIITVARQLGLPLMPWQEQVALVGGELVEHPRSGLLIPAYREVIFTVPRQCGKTLEVLAWELQRALGWDGPQRIVYSAQTGADARKKLLEDQAPILEPRKRLLGVSSVRRAAGSEAVEFKNGSRIGLLASTEDAGHGKTVDLAVKDELFADADDRRDQMLVPAMATRPGAQVVSCSTMGTDESMPWNAAVERGRHAVDTGLRSGTAYFEWSAEPDADADDPATWWSAMPALGYTIDEDVVRHARSTLKDGEFRRAFMNIPTRSDTRVIPAQAWSKVCSTDATPHGSLVFGLDMNPERSAGSIAVASRELTPVIELVDHRSTTGWMVDRAVELDAKHGPAVWCVDAGGPAGSLVEPLERAGLQVQKFGPKEIVVASASFYDAVVQTRICIRTHVALDEAVAGAVRRTVGDAWAWARRTAQVDVSPLVAATLAYAGARIDMPAAVPSRVVLLDDYLDEDGE